MTEGARDISAIEERYHLLNGRVQLSGLRALVRLIVDQRRADIAAGYKTAAFISGYPGSPLNGLDQELQHQRGLLADLNIVHVPALNEELAATAAWGSQIAQRYGSSYEGVLSVWYGKSPGLDRASDALRHANFVGTGRRGGGLVFAGDDPSAKSSSIPSSSETALADFGMPVFYPGDVQDILDLGRHAIACSRASGLVSGFKLITNVADSSAIVSVSPDRPSILVPVPDLPDGPAPEHRPNGHLLAPQSLGLERSLFEARIEVATRYLVANGVDQRDGSKDAWFGIVTAGKPYYDVRQALVDLSITERDLERLGIRILKLGAVWPIVRTEIRDFARGLREILVVEEKRPLIEDQVRASLHGMADAPQVVGKRDEHDRPLLPAYGELDSPLVAPVIVARLASRVDMRPYQPAIDRLKRLAFREVVPPVIRTPFFCSGCPHNRSTDVPDPQTYVGAGTGCTAMVLLHEGGEKGDADVVTQMGGEGAQWIGIAPFVDDPFFVQNMGDGTFDHSGQLSLRFAASVRLHATYKIYYNQAIAMTGGQAVPSGMTVAEITESLASDGVTKTIVTTEDLSRYRGVKLAMNAEVRDRSEILEAQRELRQLPGVTVLLHDQQCAAEKRRLRKRGKVTESAERVVINERVCEGCGDCSRKSDCASLRPVETEFGRKTRIHQPSCNTDLSCLDGDCPSFVTVRGSRRLPPLRRPQVRLPDPVMRARPARIRMAGIGGTGVVTVSQVLAMAALLDGAHSFGLDQTGLAQKGGVVVSDLMISDSQERLATRAPAGSVDVYLAFDLPAATQARNIAGADPDRTVCVVSTAQVPTGMMSVEPSRKYPALGELTTLLGRFTARSAVSIDASALAETIFGDDQVANMLLVGAAYQSGLIPLTGAAIEEAIRLNGVAVDVNLAAFEWGRAAVVDRPAVDAELARGKTAPRPVPGWLARSLDELAISGELRQLLELRVADLEAYQDRRYAQGYLDLIRSVLARERAALGDGQRPAISEVVAREMARLMAYKDEYEVARLHLLAAERARMASGFADGATFTWHLHPPLLRALGLERKLAFGPWFAPVFKLLRAMKVLRRTPLDIFGYARIRRLERVLPEEYRAAVDQALSRLNPTTERCVLDVCGAPDLIRGYEEVKMDGVARYRRTVAELLAELSSGRTAAAEGIPA